MISRTLVIFISSVTLIDITSIFRSIIRELRIERRFCFPRRVDFCFLLFHTLHCCPLLRRKLVHSHNPQGMYVFAKGAD
eukprot:UN08580